MSEIYREKRSPYLPSAQGNMTGINSRIVRELSASRFRRAVLAGPWLAVLLLCSGLSLGADCMGFTPELTGTPGLLGNFTHWPDAPLASGGARVSILINQITSAAAHRAAAVVSWVSVTSTDSAVLSVTAEVGPSGERVIAARSGTAGTAELQLFDAAGKLVERFPVEVRTPTRVTAQNDQTTNVLFAGSPGRECPLTMAGQDRLLTGGTLRYAVSGTLTMLPADQQAADECGSTYPIADQVWFTGTAGQGDVTITTAEGLVASQTWRVVTASDVAAITIAVDDGNVRRSGISQKITLVASARTKDGELIGGPVCNWRAADPTVRIMGNNVKNSMHGQDSLAVNLPGAGSFTVTCTIGNVQGTAQLVYPPL